MSSDAVWKRDANGVEHPSREALLASIREQCTEREKNRINEHLLSGCVPCNRIHTGLKQDSNPLNHLYHMSRRLYYPELQSNQMLLHMRRGVSLTSTWTGKRKRKFQVRSQLAGRHLKRETGLRVFRLSFPVAFGLLLLFTTVAIVLAYTIASLVQAPPRVPNQSSTQFYRQISQPTITGHQTPTATVTGTITPSPGLTVSPTSAPTIIKGAKLTVCGWSRYSGWMVPVCGRGFKGVSKVWLEIEDHGNNSFKPYGPYFVTSSGDFMIPVYLYCKNSPVIIYAANKAQQPLTLPLTYVSRAGCYLPTPNVTPGGHP